MNLYADNSRNAFDWISQRMDLPIPADSTFIYATSDDGRCLGVVSFSGMLGRIIGCSIAVDDPSAMRPLLRAGVLHAFGDLGMEAIYIIIRGNRPEWEDKLQRVVGFIEVDRVPNGIDQGVDLVVMRLSKETCPIWWAILDSARRRRAKVA